MLSVLRLGCALALLGVGCSTHTGVAKKKAETPAKQGVIGRPRNPAPSDSEVVLLAVDESVQLPGSDVHMTVEEIVYVDSPCPPGAQCIWSGLRKNVHAVLINGELAQSTILALGIPQEIFGLRIVITALTPEACEVRLLGEPLAPPAP